MPDETELGKRSSQLVHNEKSQYTIDACIQELGKYRLKNDTQNIGEKMTSTK